jgi:peptidoglycan hydrolase CwlO-like protein
VRLAISRIDSPSTSCIRLISAHSRTSSTAFLLAPVVDRARVDCLAAGRDRYPRSAESASLAQLGATVAQLGATVDRLGATVDSLTAQVTDQGAKNERQQRQIDKLRKKVKKLG